MLARNGLRFAQQRHYSDFLKGLPRVGTSGVSRFGRSKPQEANIPPAATGTVASPTKTPNGSKNGLTKGGPSNRFASQYSSSKSKKVDKQPSRKNTSKTTEKAREQASEKASEKAQQQARDQATVAAQKMAHERAKEALKKKLSNNVNSSQSQRNPKVSRNKPKRRREPVKLNIPSFVTVANLANLMGVPLQKLARKLKELGYDESRHNYILDKENAALIADEFGFEAVVNDETGADIFPAEVDESKLAPRAPIVAIMGHVDHGKTTILDHLRKLSIVKQEHGGITQHIGAFSVITPLSKKKITFLDTPGHAAFLKMRERGATVTDIIILVVAADDSVMPQTIEAIKHAKNLGVPIIVAINKCDKSTANPDKVVADLAAQGIEVEDYGGETQTVRVSGKTGLNMDLLEEAVITLGELSDIQAEKKIPGEGYVLELLVQKGLGNVATVLVKRGTLKTGDVIISGTSVCKIRGMKDESGKMIKEAGPLTPVSVWGWKDLPEAGDLVLLAKTEQYAKKISDNRAARAQQILAASEIDAINLKRKQEEELLAKQEKLAELNKAGLFEAAQELEGGKENGEAKIVNFIVKSDVFGLAEAIKESIDGLGNDEVKCNVIFEEAGQPTDLDLDRAQAADARILCFNVKVPKDIMQKASKKKIEIIEHNVIYHLIEDVTKFLTAQLTPHKEQKVVAEALVRDVFTITGKNKVKFKIAGCKVNNGNILRSSLIRVDRNGKEVYTGKLSSLKHLKDDVQEVKNGMECGLAFVGWDDFQAGDVVNIYEEIEIARYL